ncbi:sulfurtransferase [Gordonia sp. ABSL1-1]|uniref:sulfurtransferase n=1 Tax=Gordonia sp. ABSL1-1 TaxID=3053923 RepID=UPI002573D239|nr:sulfurtransferase [Gordonia sp. ABSL1-1]MDL9938629.1 sulfurtransferase [Gordonia sp. ABSL1-1]
MTAVTITADELAELMLSSTPPVVLDVRWQLGDDRGYEHYLDGHVPGSVFVDLDAELARPPAGAAGGRHPLPDVAELQAAVRRWGIDDGVTVVPYDDIGNLAAARAWWLLRWAGIADVRLLDGGLGAWRTAGFRLSTGDGGTPRVGSATLTGGELSTATIDEVAAGPDARSGGAALLDVRAPERYRGEVEPIDPRPGHIPGAVSVPTGANIDDNGRFRSAEELRERFSALGIAADDAPIVYCGSGVNAAHTVAAMEIAGFRARLFPGSYSQWSSDPDREVRTGAQP